MGTDFDSDDDMPSLVSAHALFSWPLAKLWNDPMVDKGRMTKAPNRSSFDKALVKTALSTIVDVTSKASPAFALTNHQNDYNCQGITDTTAAVGC